MNALTPTSKPASIEPAEPSLSDLTAKVKEGHQQLRDRMKYIVVGAMAIGDDLTKIKRLVGHGKFLKYVEDNCNMSNKTAERYMNLAENRSTLEAKLKELGDKFESISNLSLARAERLIDGKAGGGGGGGGNNSDKYDDVEKKLLKKFSDIAEPDTAEATAQETINKLVAIVKIKKPKFNLKLTT